MTKKNEETNEDSKSGGAFDLLKKAITVGVGAAFLTEESLRGLVSELKLPKEMIQALLSNANHSKNEFLSKLSSEVIDRVQSKIDPQKFLAEFLEKNEVEFKIKVSVKPKLKSED